MVHAFLQHSKAKTLAAPKASFISKRFLLTAASSLIMLLLFASCGSETSLPIETQISLAEQDHLRAQQLAIRTANRLSLLETQWEQAQRRDIVSLSYQEHLLDDIKAAQKASDKAIGKEASLKRKHERKLDRYINMQLETDPWQAANDLLTKYFKLYKPGSNELFLSMTVAIKPDGYARYSKPLKQAWDRYHDGWWQERIDGNKLWGSNGKMFWWCLSKYCDGIPD